MSLGELISGIGPDAVTALGPLDSGQAVSGAELIDALDDSLAEPGLLLLLPAATRLAPADIEGLAASAAAAQAAGLALKCTEEDAAAIAAIAHETGVPILRVDERVSWRLFDALLSRLLGEQRFSSSAQGDRGPEPLFALANELAELFGGSAAIEDLERRIVAYSSVPGQVIDSLRTQGILTRRVPESPFNEDQYRSVLRADHPIAYPQLDDEEPRAAIAVRAGAMPLGTIWVINPSADPETLSREQITKLHAAAAVAAAHMLDDLRARNATQLPREDRLRTLLDGTEVTGTELAELGLSEERGAALVVFAPPGEPHPITLAQLRSIVQRHFALHRPEAVTVVRGDLVYALVTCDPQHGEGPLVAPFLPLVDRLIDVGTRVALPGVAHRSSSIAQLRQLGGRLIEAAARHPDVVTERVLTVPLLRAILTFERVGEVFAAEPELRIPELDRLFAEQPAFAATLHAWCAALGNVARTARELGVHENTVRHRLQQIDERYELSLGSDDELLAVWLQLRVLHARNTRAPSALTSSNT
ncbi:PucR family transcriptional regulator [Leucobacter chromiireducens]|uniref:PucR family transcriptional regulator n=1 Tax=Leucobacter chromiireducens TaxID=283877 RepID=UPI001F151B55|nr:PucR family transcriptional regulator [Leucobacter chromiireducens]